MNKEMWIQKMETEYQKNYRHQNKEKIQKKLKDYYKQNPEHIREYYRGYYQRTLSVRRKVIRYINSLLD